jgi:sugar (pentulose or hexulose) kinase
MLNSTKNVNLSYEEIIELANQAPIGSEGLLFYPYLLGERRKDNVSARGAFFNLSLTHQAKHFCRSIMEGVALALSRDIACFKNLGVDIKKVVCLGGATRNTFLYELKTNVTNLPHYITDQPESSLSGCGILTAYALGKIDNFEENMVIHPSLIIEPEDYKVLKYNKIQNEFNRMYEHMLGYWDKKT